MTINKVKPMSWDDLGLWKPPPNNWIIGEGMLMGGSRLVAVAIKKSWKSMIFGLDLAAHLATGTPWLGFEIRKSKVLVVQVEIPQAALKDRRDVYAAGHKTMHPGTNLWYLTTRLKLDHSFGFNLISSVLDEINPDVLVLDPLYKMMLGNVCENYDMIKLLDNIDLLIDEAKSKRNKELGIILIHHGGKTQYTSDGTPINRGIEAALGASTLLNWYDTGLILHRHRDDIKKVTIFFEDFRLKPTMLNPMTLRVNTDTLRIYKIDQEYLEGGLLK